MCGSNCPPRDSQAPPRCRLFIGHYISHKARGARFRNASHASASLGGDSWVSIYGAAWRARVIYKREMYISFLFKMIDIRIFFGNFIFLYSRFLLLIYFIHISVYMSIPISQFIPPPNSPPPAFPLGVHTFVLYICVSISALQASSSVPFF